MDVIEPVVFSVLEVSQSDGVSLKLAALCVVALGFWAAGLVLNVG